MSRYLIPNKADVRARIREVERAGRIGRREVGG
jgi:hypothetical protein